MNSTSAASTRSGSIASASRSSSSGRTREPDRAEGTAAVASSSSASARSSGAAAPSSRVEPTPVAGKSVARSIDRTRCGSAVVRSERNGDSARTRAIRSGSSPTVVTHWSKSGPRTIRLPSGSQADEPPAKSRPPSEPASCERSTKIPCSAAARAAIRSHVTRLAGRDRAGPKPRAGDAQPHRIRFAPPSARIDAVSEWVRSSQISRPIRPNRVSKASTARPGSTKRLSSKSP